MTKNPPYLNAPKHIPHILGKVKSAKTPDRFTNDFLATKLGVKSSSARAFIGVAKRLGLLDQDGSPSPLYKSFRSTNASTSGVAMAKALKQGYSELYSRNEYVHALDKNDLKGLVIEATGLEADNQIVAAIVGSFEAFKPFAKFDVADESELNDEAQDEPMANSNGELPLTPPDFQLGLNYTINLVLPKTDDISVFNAIFKSLRENLLRK